LDYGNSSIKLGGLLVADNKIDEGIRCFNDGLDFAKKVKLGTLLMMSYKQIIKQKSKKYVSGSQKLQSYLNGI